MGENDPSSLLSKHLNYVFRDEELLLAAVTHRSAGKNNNERLEYLGDAVLGFIIAETLYQKFPDVSEGELTRLRAFLVRKETLAKLARKLELGQFLKLGIGERKSGGWRRASILANAMEAIIGAIYLDSGYEDCRNFILNTYSEQLQDLSPEQLSKDPKTKLQEFLQAKRQELPDYQVITEEGEAHARTFTVECKVPNLETPVVASGASKRNAEQAAAKKALELLQQ